MSDALTSALRAGQKINAIKALRDMAEISLGGLNNGTPRLSLTSAKDIVEAILYAFPQAGDEPRVGGGEHDQIAIKILPEGGYLVTGSRTHSQISAHSALREALVSAGKSLR